MGARAAPAIMAATNKASSTPNAGATSELGRVRASAPVITTSAVRIEAPTAEQATIATGSSLVAANAPKATAAVARGTSGRRPRRHRADERDERPERARSLGE